MGLGELASRGRLRPSASADPAVSKAIAELAAIYAYPPPSALDHEVADPSGARASSGRAGSAPASSPVGGAGVGSAGVGSAGVGSAGVGSAGVGSAGTGSAGTGSPPVDRAGVLRGRPWVRANMVTSVDGAGSLYGRSGGLSGAADRLVFAVLRSLADVILVGAGTARAEHYAQVRPGSVWPSLRAGRLATPPIAVVTRTLDLGPSSQLLAARAGLARTIVLTTEAAPRERLTAAAKSAEVIVAGEESVTATAAISALAVAGYHRILTEGGPTLLAELVAEDLLDDLCLTIGPVLEGGHTTRILRPAGGRGIAGTATEGAATDSPTTDQPATGLSLVSVLQDDDYLLLRYLRKRVV
jgi:riboflavin biosynthesis pyrimidine reductase